MNTKKLLLVDDDEEDQEAFRLAIQHLDPSIQVTFASSGDDALKQLEQITRPDVIFLDYVMPGMDGIECLTKLKANRRTRQIPVIIYTGASNKNENELSIRLGAFQVLSKGMEFEKLCGDIKQILFYLEKDEKALR